MFDPVVRPTSSAVVDSCVSPTAPRPDVSAIGVQQALRESPASDRSQLARDLVDGIDDASLASLAEDDDGRQALGALDDALDDAPASLGDVDAQRERIALALARDEAAGPDVDPASGATTAGITRITEQIGDNTVTWTNDSAGRPLRAEADLSEVFEGIDRSSAETRAQRDSSDRGLDTDQGGHLIGHRFVKDQGLKNLFPQDANFNVSAYKTLENEWADWIDSGHEVRIDVSLTPQQQDRPDTVSVRYEVLDPADGSVVYDQAVTFRNQSGQTFERVPRADMPLA